MKFLKTFGGIPGVSRCSVGIPHVFRNFVGKPRVFRNFVGIPHVFRNFCRKTSRFPKFVWRTRSISSLFPENPMFSDFPQKNCTAASFYSRGLRFSHVNSALVVRRVASEVAVCWLGVRILLYRVCVVPRDQCFGG